MRLFRHFIPRNDKCKKKITKLLFFTTNNKKIRDTEKVSRKVSLFFILRFATLQQRRCKVQPFSLLQGFLTVFSNVSKNA